MAAASAPLGKHLASSDKKTRDKAVSGLTAFLCDEAHASLSPLEMAKLWKGIFYCFWMSDKPLVQQALATDLANILLTIPTLDAALAFLRGFWETLVREWAGLDRLRLDKYYMLVRRYVNASFRLLLRTGWDAAACSRYNDILKGPGGPLYPNDTKVPPSLSYHLADVYIEELDKVLSSFVDDALPVPLTTIISPFLYLTADTPSTITTKRMQTALIDPLLSALQAASSPSLDDSESGPSRKRAKVSDDGSASPTASLTVHVQPKSDGSPLFHVVHNSIATLASSKSTRTKNEGLLNPSAPDQVYAAVLRSIFEIASRESTRDANRRKMYAIWKAAKDELEGEEED